MKYFLLNCYIKCIFSNDLHDSGIYMRIQTAIVLIKCDPKSQTVPNLRFQAIS